MPKKVKAPTLLAAAMSPVPPVDVQVTLVEAPVPPMVSVPDTPAEPWYKIELRHYVRDPEHLQFLTEQIGDAISWGGENHIVRMPQDALLKMLKDLNAGRVKADGQAKSSAE